MQVLSDWSGKNRDIGNLHLGDAAEGGEIDGLPATDYYSHSSWDFGINPELAKEVKKLGYFIE